jgi:type I restriction enzyme S subunit
VSVAANVALLDRSKPDGGIGRVKGWPTVALGSLATFRNGLNYTKEARERGGLPIVGVKDFQDRVTLDTAGLEELDGSKIDCGDTLLQQGDILFVRSNGNRELIGRSMFVALEPPRPTTYSGFSIRLRFQSKQADPRFYAYLLRGSVIRNTLSSQGGGTNISNLNQGILTNLKVPLPPLPIQHRIASILGAYDDLIEVNRRRIAVLEEMARRLFDEWFVHFRFPGHEGHAMVETEHGKLPEGWRRAAIKEAYDGLFDGPHATPPPASEGPVFLGIGNITESGHLDLSSVRHIAEADFENWTRRVTPSEGDIVFTYEATLNRYALIHKGFRGCLGRRLALIRTNSVVGTNRFLYLYFFTADWREVIIRNVWSGATVDRIPLSRFPDFPINLPPDEMIARFDAIVRPMFDQMHTIDKTNANLRTQRDLLLPRLISGDLSVATAERELEAAE